MDTNKSLSRFWLDFWTVGYWASLAQIQELIPESWIIYFKCVCREWSTPSVFLLTPNTVMRTPIDMRGTVWEHVLQQCIKAVYALWLAHFPLAPMGFIPNESINLYSTTTTETRQTLDLRLMKSACTSGAAITVQLLANSFDGPLGEPICDLLGDL